MKKIIIMFLVSIMLISISACSPKISNTLKSEEKPSPANVEKPITNSYVEMDKLPQEYNSELARKNGDVVSVGGKTYNIEKLDQFIETYKNKDVVNMIRIAVYNSGGNDAIIRDLIIDSEGIKLIEDFSRDSLYYLRDKNSVKTEYKVVDILNNPKISSRRYRGYILHSKN
ncbi:MAG: DUF4362 domain-containing protein [Desulfitobacteriaceae bacterium]